MKHIITEQDLINNPDLKSQGVVVGEEVEFTDPCDENGNPL